MKPRKSLALGIAAAVFLCLATSAPAVDPTQPYCALICPQTSCDADCIHAFQWTKCAIYNGQPANDYDSDGVANSSDNCKCNSNPNQADCDGDGFGNVCDGNSVNWVLIQDDDNICLVDEDYHLTHFTIEFHSREVYKNLCNNATCVKQIEEADKNCTYNTDSVTCCRSLREREGASVNCTFFPDNCGSPLCPF